MRNRLQFFPAFFFFFLTTTIQAQTGNEPGEGKKLEVEKMSARDYLPEIHGTIRGKYEYQPQMDASRFEVRNARFSVTGNVLPIVAYKAEIDLSDEGSIKMLDAYTRIFPLQDLNFTIGQMRVPFTIDAHRSPHQQYFANRSFIAKQAGNVRDVGATLEYRLRESFPLIIEGGVFNGSGLTNQKQWQKSMNYSVKAQILYPSYANLTLGVQTIKPQDVRIDMYDIGMYFEFSNFHIEGEYLFKHYRNNAFENVHAVNSFVNYDLKLPKVFRKISFLARYDMLTDHSDGLADPETGRLTVNDHSRHRLTGGITLSLGKAFVADIRLNYEKYFYKRGATAKESEQDKLVLEVMTRF